MIPEPPRELLTRAAGGDPDAFGEIVNLLMKYTYNLAYRMGGESARAEDFSQEVFLRLHRNLDRYDPARPFAPWFRTLATRTMLNELRRTQIPTLAEHDALVAAPPEPESPERLRAAIAKLPDEYRAVVTLRYLEELPVEEIAATLGVPPGTVKTWLFRARETLRTALEPFMEELT